MDPPSVEMESLTEGGRRGNREGRTSRAGPPGAAPLQVPPLGANAGMSCRRFKTLFLLAGVFVLGITVLASYRSSSSSPSVHTVDDDAARAAHMGGFHDGAGGSGRLGGIGSGLAPEGGLHGTATDDYSHVRPTEDGSSASSSSTVVGGDVSPYADWRIKMTNATRLQEFAKWRTKLEENRKTWGFWDFKDDYEARTGKPRPMAEYHGAETSGEIERDEFPEGSWQTDDEYVANFIAEARKLLDRVKEAVQAEYGWPKDGLSEAQLAERAAHFGIQFAAGKDVNKNEGIAWMPRESFDGLAKKLLNAIITNDHFFVVLGGHSAAAGHGNNFLESYMMQFNELMEPVFDRLGMVLSTSNRAQGGMGTVQSALAGGSILGEKDFVVWDSSMTEKGAGPQDLFFRQMLLTGHRAPFLFEMGGGANSVQTLNNEAGALVGGMIGSQPFLAETTGLDQAKTLPFALQHLRCASGVDTCNKKEHKYDAMCWTDRVDVEPVTPQDTAYGGQASWHPGFRHHRWFGRKLSLVFLHALEEALNVWEGALTDGKTGNPPDGKYWHVAEEEEAIRKKVRETKVEDTQCGKWFTRLPRVCSTPMRGAGEWTPRADPERTSLRSLLKPAPDGYVPGLATNSTQVYQGRNIRFPDQRIPYGEIDAVTIAKLLPRKDGGDGGRALSSTARGAGSRRSFRKGGRRTTTSTQQQPPLNPREHDPAGGRRRRLDDGDAVVPGRGWAVYNHPAGFCDGTANSQCYREPASKCLASGHNDGRGYIVGDALSGWLVFQLRNVTKGIAMARVQTWSYPTPWTEGWTELNNGVSGASNRRLKKPAPPLPVDYHFEVAVNGVVTRRWNGTEARAEDFTQVAYNVVPLVLMDDEEFARRNIPEDIELGVRVTGPQSGRKSVMSITHLYYA